MTDRTRTPFSVTTPGEQPWWKSSVVYQIYPRSFADSNGDGIGDIRGIINHLDHVEKLGANVIWLSPIYVSPMDDNGYDIANYQDIDPLFGTLADVDELIADARDRGIGIVMDLVVNHTSDEHAWFEESRSSRDNPKADWYIWRDPEPGFTAGPHGEEPPIEARPNNWESMFSGSVWEWEPRRGQYYLHLFSVKQPDLNWENVEVREAVKSMMHWWLDRGIAGFRMDVVNFLSKAEGLPEGEPTHHGYTNGFPHFYYGPRIHEFLGELRRDVFDAREGTFLTVGEMPGVSPEQGRKFTDAESGQVSMVFQFEHMDLDHGATKFDRVPMSVRTLKDNLSRWQDGLADGGWNSLYWNNHDQPRIVSRWGDDSDAHDGGPLWRSSATALATVLHMMRGTPYIYQGEELGMTNTQFADISDYRDIESLNYYRQSVDAGQDPAAVLDSMAWVSRDNARTPVQWDSSEQAGFTTGEPWIPVGPSAAVANAAAQDDDPTSIFGYYRQLITLRRELDIVVHGDYHLIEAEHEQVFAYERHHNGQVLRVLANLTGSEARVPAEHFGGQVVLANMERHNREAGVLAPWEALVISV